MRARRAAGLQSSQTCARGGLIRHGKVQQNNKCSGTPKTGSDISEKVRPNYHVRQCSFGGDVSTKGSIFE